MAGYNPELVEENERIASNEARAKTIEEMSNKELFDCYLNFECYLNNKDSVEYKELLFEEMVLRLFKGITK